MRPGYLGFPDSQRQDVEMLTAPSSFDLMAESKTRGTGGRAAVGVQLVDGGTLSVVTGANQTETFGGAALAAGFEFDCGIKTITASGKVLVFW